MVNEIVAVGIALIVYLLIFTEKVHRTIIGFFGAVIMTLLGQALGFYSQERALASIDFNTIFLLMGMMIYVGLLKETGVFEAIAIWVARVTRGNGMGLLVALGTVTAVLSAIVDNVTTIVFMAPITLSIAQSLGVSAIPLLISEAMLSNIGGIATLIGDPPNILIGSAAGLSFNDFLVHLAPLVVVIFLCAVALSMLLFRKGLGIPAERYRQFLQMDMKSALKQPKDLGRLLIIIGAGLILFFIHDLLHWQPAAVALLIASSSFLWVRPHVEKVLLEVEWNVLLLFGSLFVIVGGLEAVGVLDAIAELLGGFAKENMLVAILTILWASALLSAVVDNIPFAVVMIPIIQHLEVLGLDVGPLWWTLALGVGLGGNGTPIGSSAGIVAVSYGERLGQAITFKAWFKSGSIVTAVTLMVASLLLMMFFGLGWL